VLAIPATSSATPSLQATLNRNRLQQARQEADQLEAQAQTLRSQADQAEDQAVKGQDKVRNLSSQNTNSDTSNTTYNAVVKPSVSDLPVKTQDFLTRMYTATSPQFAASGNALKAKANSAPVLNTQGQSTGRILNIEA
jgi:small-conductance mechanosensitive channel